MAAVSFQYRSTRTQAPLTIRLRFTTPDGEKSLYTKSQFEVTKQFWQEIQSGVHFRDVEKSNISTRMENEISAIRDHVLKAFHKTPVDAIDGAWLKRQLHSYYHPEAENQLPNGLTDYWGNYIEVRRDELASRTLQRYVSVLNKIKRFQKDTRRTYMISEVDDDFKKDLIAWYKNNDYASSTIKRDFKMIQTVCRHARYKGITVSREMDGLKPGLKNPGRTIVYFNPGEIKQIAEVEGLPEYLDNARDWLLISCHTGQRVSDFMRFDPSMMRQSDGVYYIDIRQQKSGKEVTIPVIPEVIDILNKRHGQFPRPISDQKYNDYIKLVAKRAGITHKVRGWIKVDNRKQIGFYPKWQLISSHVGRRSFASNYYGKVPTSYLRNIVGHSTEAMLLAYIGRTSRDTARDAYKAMIGD